ncbi:FGGY-family carbohydrate kinase, partial [Candidatus Bipolaricaulota bacterium]
DPEDWWAGVIAAVRTALAGHAPSMLRGIGVCGMVPAIVLLDEAGCVIRPSIQQNDGRAVQEIEELRVGFPMGEFFRMTGAAWNQQVVGPKLLWIQRNEPEIWQRVRHIVGSYEYITRRLTGVTYCEANWALESGLWDAGQNRWIPELLNSVGIDETFLPSVRSSGEVVGLVAEEAATETSLPQGVPVIAGSADHISSMLPVGAIRPGHAVAKLGGAGDLLLTVDAFQPVESLYIDYHCIPNLFVVNGCMATSGSVLKWFVRECSEGRSFAELDLEAESVAAGCDGLVTLPYFLGEKTPIHDPLARGTMIGLSLSHRRVHIYRSILEGVAYAFRHHFDVLERAGHPIHCLSVTDGGAQSDLWCKILASVLQCPVVRSGSAPRGSAMGVALAAGVSMQSWGWDMLGELQGRADVFQSDLEDAKTYETLYGVYRRTYDQLQSLYPLLAGVQSAGSSVNDDRD